jgi:alpha-L-rhamnosidase
VPWVIYERYGDRRILERHYLAVLAYIDFLERAEAGRTLGTWLGYGDWLALDPEPELIPEAGAWADCFGGTPREYLWDAFDIHSTDLAGRIALVLGRGADVRRLRDRALRRRADFKKRYVGGDGHLLVRTQTALVLALHFGLLNGKQFRSKAAADLVAHVENIGHIQTGFVGTPYILHALTEIGRADLAYGLLERTDYPGWLYSVTQGATTIWERWNAWRPDRGPDDHQMNSFNHYAYGAVGEWLFRVVGGIDTAWDAPGYSHSLICPELGGTLTSVTASVDTHQGRIAVSWQLTDGSAAIQITVPANTNATLRLPAAQADLVSENGVMLPDIAGISDVRTYRDRVQCEAVGGRYDLLIRDPLVSRKPLGD